MNVIDLASRTLHVHRSHAENETGRTKEFYICASEMSESVRKRRPRGVLKNSESTEESNELAESIMRDSEKLGGTGVIIYCIDK